MIKLYKIIISLSFCIISIFAGCNKPYEIDEYKETASRLDAMRFTAEIDALAVEGEESKTLKFSEGDTFGLYAVIRGPGEDLLPTGNFMDNVKFTSNASGEISCGKDMIWPDEILHFYAYYPYREEWNENLQDLSYSTPLNQGEVSDEGAALYYSADILYARKTGIKPNSLVDLKFSHLMGQIVINLKSGIRNPDIGSLPVSILGAVAKAKINLETGEVKPDGDNSAVLIPFITGTDGERACKAVIVPQVLNLVIETEFQGDKIRIERPDFEIKGGWQYNFDLVVDDTGIKFVQGDVIPWEGLDSEQMTADAEEVVMPYYITIPKFDESFVYRVMLGEEKQIAEICEEYLYSDDMYIDQAQTEKLSHKAVVAYPVSEISGGKMVADHTKGFVLQILKQTINGTEVSYTVDESAVHGGKVSFSESGITEYIPGTSAPVDEFYMSGDNFFTTKQEASIDTELKPYIIEDDPSRYETGVKNTYKITKIGSQYWTAENLRAVKYNDGEPITYISPDDKDTWAGSNANRTGKYTWYKDSGIDVSTNTDYKNLYGALYNWTSISKGAGGAGTTFPFDVEEDFIAPLGWKVPSRNEYKVLYSYLGSNKPRMLVSLNSANMANSGYETDRLSAQWPYNTENFIYTNITNFSAINSGYCDRTHSYFADTFYMYFSTSGAATRGYGFKLPFDAGPDDKYITNHSFGLSLRCIRTE